MNSKSSNGRPHYDGQDGREITRIDSLKKKIDLIKVNFEYYIPGAVFRTIQDHDFSREHYVLRLPEDIKSGLVENVIGIVQRENSGEIMFTPNQAIGGVIWSRKSRKALIPFFGKYSPSVPYTRMEEHFPARSKIELKSDTDLIEFYKYSNLEDKIGSVSVKEIKLKR